jgi:hypothetical protein
MYIWSAWHDRPMCWACDRIHYNTLYRPKQLPSVSQFCRRLKTPRVKAMLQAACQYLNQCHDPNVLTFLDGKPLPVSESTRDPDAKTGRGNGRFSRGYKLHAWTTNEGKIQRFRVTPLNAGEPTVAMELSENLPSNRMVLADTNYDSAKLYEQIEQCGSQLLTPLKGKAASPGRLKQMPAARRNILQLWQEDPAWCEAALTMRGSIERTFGTISCFGGGLSPLPAWVRRLERVERWVTAKLIIYHARLQARKQAAA